MAFSSVEVRHPRAVGVKADGDTLRVDLSDGRAIAVPLAWYPRLAHATATERRRWRLVGDGDGIHWPDLDEDVAVAALLAGKPSAESRESLQHWLATRKAPPVGRGVRRSSASPARASITSRTSISICRATG